MKLDFAAIHEGKITYAEAVREVTYAQIVSEAAALFESIQSIITDANDAIVTFIPTDPATSEQGWTLSHVVAHLTATLEESAALAAMLARGVRVEGRLRYEVPWEGIRTLQQLQARLTESRRIVQALLNAWPDEPHLDVTITLIPAFGPMNAIGAFVLGLTHGQGHLDQLREIMRQDQQVR